MKKQILFSALAIVVGVIGYIAVPAAAQEPVILTVEGKITGDAPIDFTRAQLEALGLESETTSTPWYDDPATFEGVRLSRLLDSVGAQGEVLRATALNNYYAEIPFADARDFEILIALKKDGDYMSVREKGPLFIIYPFDRKPDTKNELYYSKSVWQLRRLTVN